MADSSPAPTKPAAKKATKPKKPADHPPTMDMVKKAVAALKERTGSSRAAIKKYLAAEFKYENIKAINAALKKGVEKGVLVQVKASYKLSAEAKKAPKKPAAKKPAAAKKPKVKKAKTPKKDKKPKVKKTPKKSADKATKKSAKKATKAKTPSKAKKAAKPATKKAPKPKTAKPKKATTKKAAAKK